MDSQESRGLWFEPLLQTSNPWWADGGMGQRKVEDFHRPIFYRLFKDLKELKQILSITGPRRIGKTQLLLQTIQQLIQIKVAPQRILYLSLDDPLLSAVPEGPRILDELVKRYFREGKGGSKYSQKEPVYIFLDEVQRFDKWELYLKKYYDLGYPIRWMVTGSASSPILKKSHESLLGRIKEYHLLPFSFREYVLFRHREDKTITGLINSVRDRTRASESLGDLDGARIAAQFETCHEEWTGVRDLLLDDLQNFFLFGGFPEVCVNVNGTFTLVL